MIPDNKHPCEIDKTIIKSKNKLCHTYTKKMGHNLKAIMKAMKLSLGRGKSHLNITQMLDELNGKIKYATKSIDYNLIRDINSILPSCTLKMIETNSYNG